MEAFIRSTAWEIHGLKPYDLFHIAFFVFALIAIHHITVRLMKCTIRTSNIVLFGTGLFLLITEIYKQLFYYYIVSPGEYSWWIFPFQICSTPMYLMLILPFIKSEKVETIILDYIFAFGTFGGLATFLFPSGMIHDHIMLTLHSFVWHMLLMFAGIHIMKSRLKTMPAFDQTRRLYLVFAVVALTINVIVGNGLGEYINVFFLGPQRSEIFGLSALYDAIGWLGPLLVMVVAVPVAIGNASRQLLIAYYRRYPLEEDEEVTIKP